MSTTRPSGARSDEHTQHEDRAIDIHIDHVHSLMSSGAASFDFQPVTSRSAARRDLGLRDRHGVGSTRAGRGCRRAQYGSV